jgi:hypothetical protein
LIRSRRLSALAWGRRWFGPVERLVILLAVLQVRLRRGKGIGREVHSRFALDLAHQRLGPLGGCRPVALGQPTRFPALRHRGFIHRPGLGTPIWLGGLESFLVGLLGMFADLQITHRLEHGLAGKLGQFRLDHPAPGVKGR